MTRTYAIFLMGLFTIGIGLAILQTAANPYITILGPKERAAQRISIMGICNKAAGILSPLVFAAVILRPTDTDLFAQLSTMSVAERGAALDELVRRVIVPYAVLGTLSVRAGLSGLPLAPARNQYRARKPPRWPRPMRARTSIFQFPHLILGALAIFLHVGTQVIAIDTIIGYANSMGIDLLEAKVFPSYTLFCTICGYLIGIISIPRFISQVNALRICTLLGTLFTLLIIFAQRPGHVSGPPDRYFDLVRGVARTGQFAGLGGYLAAGAGWPGTLYQTGRVHPDHGSVRQCHHAPLLRLLCRSVRSTHRLLGAVSLLPVPGFLRGIKAHKLTEMGLLKISNGTLITPYRIIRGGTLVIDDGLILGIHEGAVDVPDATELDAGGTLCSTRLYRHSCTWRWRIRFYGWHGRSLSRHCRTPRPLRHYVAGTNHANGRKRRSLYKRWMSMSGPIEPTTQGATFLGMHLEGPYFALSQRGAQDPRYIRNPDPQEYEEILAYSRPLSGGALHRSCKAPFPSGSGCAKKAFLPPWRIPMRSTMTY